MYQNFLGTGNILSRGLSESRCVFFFSLRVTKFKVSIGKVKAALSKTFSYKAKFSATKMWYLREYIFTGK